MSYSKPLAYDSLKTVLQHMEVNKRFNVALHCPAIRKAEKAVSLKIAFLSLNSRKVKVNDTSYRLGCTRKYPKGKRVPKLHQKENKEGGVDDDLDKYGAPEVHVEHYLTPGDIFVREPHQGESDQARISDYQLQILRLKITTNLDPSRSEAGYKLQMQPYLNRRDNLTPRYKIKLLFTVKSHGSKQIKILKKTKRLDEYMKQLTTFMFGGRQEPVIVKTLKLGRSLDILRVPPHLKFRIKSLIANFNVGNNLMVLDPIIDAKSVPLDFLNIGMKIKTEEDLDHPYIKSAKKLILTATAFPQFVSKLSNPKVHLKMHNAFHGDLLPVIVDVLQNVLKNWFDNGREIGSCYSFDTIRREVDGDALMHRLMEVAAEFNGIRVHNGLIKVPFNWLSEIHIILECSGDKNDFYRHYRSPYRVRNENEMDSSDEEDENEKKFEREDFLGEEYIKMCIVPIGSE